MRAADQTYKMQTMRIVPILCSTILILIHRQAVAAPGDVLKEFISSPPLIAEMVAELCDTRQTNAATECKYVLLRYQTNAFYYREAPDLLGLSSTNIYPHYFHSGYFESTYWHFSSDGLTLEVSTNAEASLRATLNNVIGRASKILRLGVFDTMPGFVTWDDNSFHSSTNAYGVWLEGDLVFTPNANQKLLKLRAKTSAGIAYWEIEYDFTTINNVPRNIPTMISAFTVSNGVRRPQFNIKILTLNLGQTPQPESAFVPGAFVDIVRNEVLRGLNSTLVRDPLNRSFRKLNPPEPGFRWLLALLLAANALVVIVIGVIRWRRNTKKS